MAGKPSIALDQDIATLKEWAAINSGTGNIDGVNRFGDLVAKAFEAYGFKLKRYKRNGAADLLYLHTPKKTVKPNVLISGHLDTVFEPSANFTSIKENNSYLAGPGVNDMKGALVIALRAVRELSLHGVLHNVSIILSPDEEVGSVAHLPTMKRIAKEYDYGLVLEGVGDNWELCNSRKGIARLGIVTKGRAGHSGHWAQRYPNAIDALVPLVTATVALADLEAGTTINTGLIRGGEKINIVADKAQAFFDLRYKTKREYERVEQALHKLCAESGAKGVIEPLFPPLEPNKKTMVLMRLVEDAGKSIGRKITFHSRGSASDGNWMSECGLGVLDGFGTKGYDHHTVKERMLKSSVLRQSKLLKATIERILQ